MQDLNISQLFSPTVELQQFNTKNINYIPSFEYSLKRQLMLKYLASLVLATGLFFSFNLSAQQADKSIPTIWDSIPNKGKYDWFKNNSANENLKTFQMYESRKEAKTIAACIPNAYGFYIVAQWYESIENENEAERWARKICKNDAAELLAFAPEIKIDRTWRDEVYVDKFTNQKIKLNILTFTDVWHNESKKECEIHCIAWVWADSVVISGYSLILGGTTKDIPVRVRLGNRTFTGECKLSDRGNCILALRGISSLDFANSLRSHHGDIAIEFTQKPSSVIGELSKSVTNWNMRKEVNKNNSEIRK
jgi:hypothetical protein